MQIRFLLIIAIFFSLSGEIFSQNPDTNRRGYEVGPGDKISGKVLGEPDFNFDSVVDDDGRIQVPFSDEGIIAACKTERELREIVTQHLLKYLRNPQISVNVVEKNRPPVTVYGEIASPQRIVLTRDATLLEIISFAGGMTKESNGVIEVTRTIENTCSKKPEDRWTAAENNQMGFPTKSFSFSALKETNPAVFPGDVVLIQRFPPVYVVGEVLKPGEISIPEEGLGLMQALAMASGVGREAKIKDIKIYRRKDKSSEPDVISVNIEKIRKGESGDVRLQPYDIVDVGLKPRTFGSVLLDIAGVSVKSAANTLPVRTF
jgi:polysaccharide export outer membrane protein